MSAKLLFKYWWETVYMSVCQSKGFLFSVVLVFIFLLSLTIAKVLSMVSVAVKSIHDDRIHQQLLFRVACAYSERVNSPNQFVSQACGLVSMHERVVKLTRCARYVQLVINAASNDAYIQLNTLDFFARVPVKPSCRGVVKHRLLWWYEA